MHRSLPVALVVLAACGSAPPPPPPPDNHPSPAQAGAPSPSCRAAVAKRYTSGNQDYIDPSGRHVVVTESDPCGLVVQPVYFVRDTAVFQQPIVDELAGMLSCFDQVEHLRLRIAIVGYAAADEHDREALATARARAVARYLGACGVPGLGFTTEIVTSAPAHGVDDRDRRVDFLITERRTTK